jgi:hypothetical protein
VISGYSKFLSDLCVIPFLKSVKDVTNTEIFSSISPTLGTESVFPVEMSAVVVRRSKHCANGGRINALLRFECKDNSSFRDVFAVVVKFVDHSQQIVCVDATIGHVVAGHDFPFDVFLAGGFPHAGVVDALLEASLADG